MNNNEAIRLALRAYLDDQGLTAEGLGPALGVSSSTSIRWCNGKSKEIRPSHWSKLRPLLSPYLEAPAVPDLRAEVTRIVREVTGRVVPVGPLRDVPVFGEDAAKVLLERLTRQRLEAQRANVPRLAELSREIPKARARLDAAGEVFFSGRVTLDNAAHFNALLTEARMSLERLQAEERAILTEQAAELPDLQAVVDRLRYWGELLDRCDNDDTRRAFLQARVSQVTVQEDRSVRLALVMTNEEVWQPRLELVIPIAATAARFRPRSDDTAPTPPVQPGR